MIIHIYIYIHIYTHIVRSGYCAALRDGILRRPPRTFALVYGLLPEEQRPEPTLQVRSSRIWTHSSILSFWKLAMLLLGAQDSKG